MSTSISARTMGTGGLSACFGLAHVDADGTISTLDEFPQAGCLIAEIVSFRARSSSVLNPISKHFTLALNRRS